MIDSELKRLRKRVLSALKLAELLEEDVSGHKSFRTVNRLRGVVERLRQVDALLVDAIELETVNQ